MLNIEVRERCREESATGGAVEVMQWALARVREGATINHVGMSNHNGEGVIFARVLYPVTGGGHAD